MQRTDNIVIFDFCQTLCNFETADAFVEFVSRSESNIRIRAYNLFEKILVKTKLILLFDVYGHIMHHSVWKRILLKKLKGIERGKLEYYADKYYKERIRPNLIEITMQRLLEAQDRGYSIAIVSASYDIFLKLFVQEFNIGLLVTNTLEFDKDNKFTGGFKGKDCIYKNKVRRFRNAIGGRQVNIQESYGDSQSDIPILSISKNGYVISHCSHKKWIEKTTFNELIWQ